MNTNARAEYFRREADDYLRELEPLLGQGVPPVDALIRLARGLRGAAMLAGPSTFANAATQLDLIIRQVRDGELGWEDVAPRLRKAVGEFRRLAGSATEWSDRRDAEATRLAGELGQVAGAPPAPAVPHRPDGASAARGYVAREAAVVAGTVELAAREVAPGSAPPAARLAEVTRAMQSLQGVAAVADYPPLADMLEALRATVAHLGRYPALPDGASGVLRTAGSALSRSARAVAAGEVLPADFPEAEALAQALESTIGRAPTPIGDLLAAGGGTVSPFGGRGGPTAADPVDLSGLGEYLTMAADTLRAAPSAVSLRLRRYAIVTTLRGAPGGLGRIPAGPFVAALIDALGEDGPAVSEVVDMMDRAGRALTAGARGELQALGRDLDQLAVRLGGRPFLPSPPAEAGPEAVPISTLLLEPEPMPPPAAAPGTRTTFEQSFSRYSHLVRTGPEPSLAPEVVPIESLLEDSTSEPAAEEPVPIEQLILPQAGVVPIEDLLLAEEEVVPVQSLLYRGRSALERADTVRRELESVLRASPDAAADANRLVRELLDLVPLALQDD